MTTAGPDPRGRALALALTGVDLDDAVVDDAAPAPDGVIEVLGRLSRRGWDRERIAVEAARAHAAGEPWPHPVAPERRGGIGAAAWHAMLAEAKRVLGIDQPARLTVAQRPLDADERRLSADLPPHHGHVG